MLSYFLPEKRKASDKLTINHESEATWAARSPLRNELATHKNRSTLRWYANPDENNGLRDQRLQTSIQLV